MKNQLNTVRADIIRPLLTATLVLATAFTLGCGEHTWEDFTSCLDDDEKDIFDCSLGVFEDVLIGPSSSSEKEISSSSEENERNDIDINDDTTPSSNSQGTAVVGPLLKTQWGRGEVFESMLPMKSRFGCFGRAVAQIMAFHKYPNRGSGHSEPYTTSYNVEVPSVNFDAVYFDWDNMLNKYKNTNATEKQQNAVAALFYYVGIAIKANFGVDGVGGSCCASGGGVVSGLTTYLGYDKSVQRIYRKYYDDSAWEAIIKEQLNSGLPIFYHGVNSDGTSDHAFVIDGYDNTGKFHINWGWNGSYDGYYSLNALNPDNYDFNHNNYILINIKPDKGGVESFAMALDSFSVAKTTITQNELLIVNAGINKQSDSPFDGQTGVALVDSRGNIAAVIGSVKLGSKYSINSVVPETVNPGQYSLRVATRPTGGEWKIVTAYNRDKKVPNAFDFTVLKEIGAKGGGYGLALTEFTTERNSVNIAEAFKVSMKLKNIDEERYPGGKFGVALVDNSGNIVEVINSYDVSGLDAGYTRSVGLNCKVPSTVSSGQYRLRIVVKPSSNDEWRVATMAVDGVPTAVDFAVK